MKNFATTLTTTAILILAICMTGIAQTSANSTQARTSNSANAKLEPDLSQTKAEVSGLRADVAERQLARLIQEIKAGRSLIESQQTQIEALQTNLDLETRNSQSLASSYGSAISEINSLRLAITSSQETIAAKNETIAVLTNQRDDERSKRKKANKRATLATIGAAALIILKVVKF